MGLDKGFYQPTLIPVNANANGQMTAAIQYFSSITIIKLVTPNVADCSQNNVGLAGTIANSTPMPRSQKHNLHYFSGAITQL